MRTHGRLVSFPSTFSALAKRDALCPRSMRGTTRRQTARHLSAHPQLARSHWSVTLVSSFRASHLSISLLCMRHPHPLPPSLSRTALPKLICFSCTSNPHNEAAQRAVKKFAITLAARFDPVIGCTRSWDTGDPTNFPVISHADKTIINHVRAEGAPLRNLVQPYGLPS
jgi:hypothetical protein